MLLGLERFSRRHYRIVFLLAALALGLGAWLGSKLELESNILALVPEGRDLKAEDRQIRAVASRANPPFSAGEHDARGSDDSKRAAGDL